MDPKIGITFVTVVVIQGTADAVWVSAGHTGVISCCNTIANITASADIRSRVTGSTCKLSTPLTAVCRSDSIVVIAYCAGIGMGRASLAHSRTATLTVVTIQSIPGATAGTVVRVGGAGYTSRRCAG